jgi:hypothetical protein
MFVTTVGLLGTFIFAAIICIILGCIFATWLRQIADLKRRSREGEDGARETNVNSPLLFWAVAGSWLILLAAFCVINFSSVHWMLFWLFSALIVVLHGHFTKTLLPQKSFSLKTTPQYALATSFGFIVVFSSIIILSIYFFYYDCFSCKFFFDSCIFSIYIRFNWFVFDSSQLDNDYSLY